MTETYHLSLPLVAAAQAQKHVTLNAALAKLDALAQLRVVSAVVTTPPGGAADGQSYIVPAGASGVWAGHETQLAVFANGAWEFIQPKVGWTAWNEAEGAPVTFNGAGWGQANGAGSAGGAATLQQVVEVDHTVGSGATSTVVGAIPAQMMVTGVSGRVTSAFGGGATGWSLGVSGSSNRYGSGLGLAKNSYVLGLTGQPQAYHSDTDLILTAAGGTFSGGEVRLAIHGVILQPPAAV